MSDDIMANDVYPLIIKSLAAPYYYPPEFETEHMRKRDFDAVIHASVDLLLSNCSDFRIVCQYIYASSVWLTATGIVGLFPILHILLDEQLEQLLPADMPEDEKLEQIDQSLVLLFDKINRKLGFLAEQKKPELTDLLAQLDSQALEEMARCAEAFIDLTESLLASCQCLSIEQIRQFQQYMADIALDQAKLQRQQAQASQQEAREAKLEASQADQDQPAATDPLASLLPSGSLSASLEQLIKKLTTFQYLLNRQDYIKAVIVMTDIAQTIENFDPRLFFPELFKPFVKAQVSHADPLLDAQMMVSQQSNMQALNDLYQLDLDAFIDFDIDPSIQE